MSFLNFFSGDFISNHSSFPWIPLEQIDQIDEVIERSYEKPVMIFKHSTRCSISRFALRQWENQSEVNSANYFLIDVLEYKLLSQYVAERLEIKHESPQVIVIKNREVITNLSHQNVQWDLIKLNFL